MKKTTRKPMELVKESIRALRDPALATVTAGAASMTKNFRNVSTI